MSLPAARCHPDTAADSDLLTVHAPTPLDVEQLRLVAADAEAPLTDADLAFLASEQLVLRTDGPDRLAVVGIATTSYFAAVQVGRAIAEARTVWTVIQHASRSRIGELNPEPGLRCPRP